MKKEYTSEQMELWGQFNLFFGCALVAGLLAFLGLIGPPLEWPYLAGLSILCVIVAWLYYRQYCGVAVLSAISAN